MAIILRDIDKQSDQELEIVTRRTMDTVLETIPEFGNDPEVAHKAFGNFTFPQMKEMILGSFSNPNLRTVVAVDETSGELVGHAIFSCKIDLQGKKYGSCYTRYVVPAHRKKGIASSLLNEAEAWWAKLGAEYILAQTHVENVPLQLFFKKHGFSCSELKRGKFPFYELRKSLK